MIVCPGIYNCMSWDICLSVLWSIIVCPGIYNCLSWDLWLSVMGSIIVCPVIYDCLSHALCKTEACVFNSSCTSEETQASDTPTPCQGVRGHTHVKVKVKLHRNPWLRHVTDMADYVITAGVIAGVKGCHQEIRKRFPHKKMVSYWIYTNIVHLFLKGNRNWYAYKLAWQTCKYNVQEGHVLKPVPYLFWIIQCYLTKNELAVLFSAYRQTIL